MVKWIYILRLIAVVCCFLMASAVNTVDDHKSQFWPNSTGRRVSALCIHLKSHMCTNVLFIKWWSSCERTLALPFIAVLDEPRMPRRHRSLLLFIFIISVLKNKVSSCQNSSLFLANGNFKFKQNAKTKICTVLFSRHVFCFVFFCAVQCFLQCFDAMS